MSDKKPQYILNEAEKTEIEGLLADMDENHLCEKWAFHIARKAVREACFSSVDSHDAHSYCRCCDQVGCSGKGNVASLKILAILRVAERRGDATENSAQTNK